MVEKIKKMVESKKKGFVSGIIVGMLVFSTLMLAYTTIVSGASPSIVYASPDNGDTFVDVWRGKGVNITVNVSDGDGDLNQVVLKWNNSGTWNTFYDSGALGGVSYHNHTVLNTNFTGSWEEYEYQICAYDTVWTNTTYSFTTEYVWGDPVMVYYNDEKNLYYPSILKNNTNDYFVAWVNWDDYDVETKHSTTGFFITSSVINAEIDTRNQGTYNTNRVAYLYSYNGKCYIAYTDDYGGSDIAYYYTKYWNGSEWVGKTKTELRSGIDGKAFGDGVYVIYYYGEWHTVIERGNDPALFWHHGSFPFSGTGVQKQNVLSAYNDYNYYPSLAIFEGKLVFVFRDTEDDLHWQTYDGVNWVDKGDIELDIGDYGCKVIKDPVNNQLVVVYGKSDGFYYRILTSPDGSWSSSHKFFTPVSGKVAKHLYVQYIDHRLTVVFSYNLRGTYDIYMISAPDYMSEAHGVLQQYNRIQFPDATPNQQHVNSSVFYFKNIDSRTITEINITFADIGSIQCESNFKLWGSTDNSSWTDLGTTDASGILGPINSGTWATGMNWGSGEIRYFKLEILDISDVPEDLHNTDESFIWEITLE
ncbi:MAG: hypothetical protein J7L32_04410 [Thermoplasmata archaeon]|nr:hypothetical protein [Thermoplasmata archaeon]